MSGVSKLTFTSNGDSDKGKSATDCAVCVSVIFMSIVAMSGFNLKKITIRANLVFDATRHDSYSLLYDTYVFLSLRLEQKVSTSTTHLQNV